jgi:hypothetical protein
MPRTSNITEYVYSKALKFLCFQCNVTELNNTQKQGLNCSLIYTQQQKESHTQNYVTATTIELYRQCDENLIKLLATSILTPEKVMVLKTVWKMRMREAIKFK